MTFPAIWRRLSAVLPRLLLILSGLLAAAFLWSTFCTTPLVIWNAPRLAPSFAIAYGLNPYAAGDSALHLGMMYMPMFALWNLPATLAPNLTLAFAVEWGLNLVAIFVPFWLLFRWVWPERRLVWAGLLAILFIRLSGESTASAFLFLHLDALCVGFVLLAALAMLHASETGSTRATALAGISVAAAVWTKQLAIAAPLALLTWCLWQRRPKIALRFLCWAVGSGVALGLIFFTWFSPKKLLFSAYLLPAKLPWEADVSSLRQLFVTFLQTHWLWCVLWLALAPFLWQRLRHSRSASRGEKLCVLMLWLALWHFPLGLLAQFIPGGGLNSLFSIVFAGVVLAWGAVERWRTPSAELATAYRPRLTLASLALATTVFALSQFQTVWKPTMFQDELVTLAQAHRGKIYFPFNPLITLVTERRILPFDDAISDLRYAGLLPPIQLFRDAIPPDTEIIIPVGVQQCFVCDLLGRTPNQSPSVRGSAEPLP
jgi:hypothetical protein